MLQIDEMLSPAIDTLFVEIEEKDKLRHIQYIINRLPDQQKKLIRMKIWEDLSDGEIEQQTGLTKGNIKVIISRARKMVRKLYQKWEKYEKSDFIR
jgi:RNA polymerase sigma-70 factor (ECF subfamily)